MQAEYDQCQPEPKLEKGDENMTMRMAQLKTTNDKWSDCMGLTGPKLKSLFCCNSGCLMGNLGPVPLQVFRHHFSLTVAGLSRGVY